MAVAVCVPNVRTLVVDCAVLPSASELSAFSNAVGSMRPNNCSWALTAFSCAFASVGSAFRKLVTMSGSVSMFSFSPSMSPFAASVSACMNVVFCSGVRFSVSRYVCTSSFASPAFSLTSVVTSEGISPKASATAAACSGVCPRACSWLMSASLISWTRFFAVCTAWSMPPYASALAMMLSTFCQTDALNCCSAPRLASLMDDRSLSESPLAFNVVPSSPMPADRFAYARSMPSAVCVASTMAAMFSLYASRSLWACSLTVASFMF